ncbi:flavodoxin family protein [Methanoplanus endosymbiosus]|uniref:Flavodoxin family protein n=1 Tax=Methanoplanus endosymbiosus TaxID=33865 RepID=A0A9E7TI55_9EURY|nr:flavodoxin family protein [Methanoplanus endosymbiosus]UUX91918.1 flavodoxin family protein [Methanoplanus endosymbiosus]
MKVTGFVGSPRKNGNTAALVFKTLEGAEKAGAETELIYLCDYDFKDCQGCMNCKVNDSCRLEDGMQELYGKIRDSDAIVFGTPVYFSHMSGLMKSFIDRMYALIDKEYNSRIDAGMKYAVVMTQGNPDRAAFKDITKTFDFAMHFFKGVNSGWVVAGGLAKPKDVLEHEDILDEAFETGIKLAGQRALYEK